MEDKYKIFKKRKTFNDGFHNTFQNKRNSLKHHKLTYIFKEKDKDSQKTLNFQKKSMRSDNKIINFSEMIPKLLEQIKTKNSLLYEDKSFENDSNSSEINDEKSDEIHYNFNSKPSNSLKIPKLLITPNDENKDIIDEYKNLQAPITYRENRNKENQKIEYRKFSKENKDSLIIKLHKYFFQDGEFENIDTLIKYNLNQIKINKDNKDEDNSYKNLGVNNINNNNEFDYLTIKQQVINLMDKFADAFDKENKGQLISAIKDLSVFSEKHKFDYVTQLTLNWLQKLKDKKYDKCELKYIGYYNQIRDIMDKMLKELKKKADLIILAEQKKNKDIKNEKNNIDNNNINNSNNNRLPSIIMNPNLKRSNSINKEDIFKTKEIVPIKIDIEVQNTLNINEVEEILKHLDEGDLGNSGSNNIIYNNKKQLNKHFNNRNENELEAFSYPFKKDNLCNIY